MLLISIAVCMTPSFSVRILSLSQTWSKISFYPEKTGKADQGSRGTWFITIKSMCYFSPEVANLHFGQVWKVRMASAMILRGCKGVLIYLISFVVFIQMGTGQRSSCGSVEDKCWFHMLLNKYNSFEMSFEISSYYLLLSKNLSTTKHKREICLSGNKTPKPQSTIAMNDVGVK